MRDIKFRAWSPQHEKMFRIENICFDGAPTVVLQYGPRIRTRLDNVFLMQFTGLHDKNGKEIYEGDIITASQPSCNYLVSWDEKRCCYVGTSNEGDKYGAYTLKISVASRYDENLFKNEIVIIGNIHQNPELLEELV